MQESFYVAYNNMEYFKIPTINQVIISTSSYTKISDTVKKYQNDTQQRVSPLSAVRSTFEARHSLYICGKTKDPKYA